VEGSGLSIVLLAAGMILPFRLPDYFNIKDAVANLRGAVARAVLDDRVDLTSVVTSVSSGAG
jgi:hypothetical protein